MEIIQRQCLVRVPIPHAPISLNLPSSSSSISIAVVNPSSGLKTAILYTPPQVVVPKQKQVGRRRRIGHSSHSFMQKNPRVEEVLQKLKPPSTTLQDALPDKTGESLFKWDFFSIMDDLQQQHNVKRSLEEGGGEEEEEERKTMCRLGPVPPYARHYCGWPSVSVPTELRC